MNGRLAKFRLMFYWRSHPNQISPPDSPQTGFVHTIPTHLADTNPAQHPPVPPVPRQTLSHPEPTPSKTNHSAHVAACRVAFSREHAHSSLPPRPSHHSRQSPSVSKRQPHWSRLYPPLFPPGRSLLPSQYRHPYGCGRRSESYRS